MSATRSSTLCHRCRSKRGPREHAQTLCSIKALTKAQDVPLSKQLFSNCNQLSHVSMSYQTSIIQSSRRLLASSDPASQLSLRLSETVTIRTFTPLKTPSTNPMSIFTLTILPCTSTKTRPRARWPRCQAKSDCSRRKRSGRVKSGSNHGTVRE